MNQACPLPDPTPADEQAVIRRLIAARRIAVVGVSLDPSKPSHYVAAYLQSVGKEVIPVNPTIKEVLGVRALAEIDGPIDLVNVFRLPQYCPQIAREAVAIGAKGLWLQSGIISAEAREIADAAQMDYVENRCLMVEHRMGAR